MTDTPAVECGDRVRFSRGVGDIIRDVGIVEEINNHRIYGTDGELLIRVPSGARYRLPQEAVVEVINDTNADAVGDGGSRTCVTVGCSTPAPSGERYCEHCEGVVERALRDDWDSENGSER